MMDETYVEVTLSVPADDALRETISFQLQQLGFTGFLENDDSVQCYIQKQNWNDSLHAKLLTMWNGNQSFPVTISHIVEIQHQNWNRQWEESIQPIEVTEKITITP